MFNFFKPVKGNVSLLSAEKMADMVKMRLKGFHKVSTGLRVTAIDIEELEGKERVIFSVYDQISILEKPTLVEKHTFQSYLQDEVIRMDGFTITMLNRIIESILEKLGESKDFGLTTIEDGLLDYIKSNNLVLQVFMQGEKVVVLEANRETKDSNVINIEDFFKKSFEKNKEKIKKIAE